MCESYFQINILKKGSVGCHRVLKESPETITNDEMTVQYCIEVCRSENSNLAALHHDTCLCLSGRGALEEVAHLHCHQGCRGFPQQICGGVHDNETLFSVYLISMAVVMHTDYVNCIVL